MNKGNSSDDCFPKFFKVYLPDDSGDDLEIPVSFNSFLPKSLPRKVIVRSIYGKIWKLELRKRCGEIEKFGMVDGWKRIVKDEDLKGGEFLAFEFDGYRLFNFCIYGHATCKRLGNSVKTKEVEDESDGEDDKSSDGIIVIDDDDENEDDGDDDDEGDDDDDDDDDDQDYGEEDKSSVEIIVIDDDSTDADNDDVSGDQDSGDEDKSREEIIVIDDDDDDDYADGDQDADDERRSGVETERKD